MGLAEKPHGVGRYIQAVYSRVEGNHGWRVLGEKVFIDFDDGLGVAPIMLNEVTTGFIQGEFGAGGKKNAWQGLTPKRFAQRVAAKRGVGRRGGGRDIAVFYGGGPVRDPLPEDWEVLNKFLKRNGETCSLFNEVLGEGW